MSLLKSFHAGFFKTQIMTGTIKEWLANFLAGDPINGKCYEHLLG